MECAFASAIMKACRASQIISRGNRGDSGRALPNAVMVVSNGRNSLTVWLNKDLKCTKLSVFHGAKIIFIWNFSLRSQVFFAALSLRCSDEEEAGPEAERGM